ncbi:MAG TPA: hypothetical protein PKG52_02420 [bacterium]|nr:hypothetical protein [bacterium]HPS30598.1 hypothetical protein [bacterium]
MSTENSKFKYYKLPVREIENLISEGILKDALKKIFPKLSEQIDVSILKEYENEYLGSFLKEKSGLPESFKAKSDTISTPYKLKLANVVAENIATEIFTWENMSPQAQELTEEIYKFIRASNK